MSNGVGGGNPRPVCSPVCRAAATQPVGLAILWLAMVVGNRAGHLPVTVSTARPSSTLKARGKDWKWNGGKKVGWAKGNFATCDNIQKLPTLSNRGSNGCKYSSYT